MSKIDEIGRVKTHNSYTYLTGICFKSPLDVIK